MLLRYLLDEHLRRRVWRAIQQHNAKGIDPLDAVRVGDPPDLPLGAPDADILLWGTREGRILVSRDKRTLPLHLAAHLQTGQHSPGVFLVRQSATVDEVIAFLVLADRASAAIDWQDQAAYIP